MMFASSLSGVPPAAPMTKEETLDLRKKLIPKTCSIHFERAPLKITRAYGQYMYDDAGSEYLDCVNCVAHVGHCNPSVVSAGKEVMSSFGCLQELHCDTAGEYICKLKTTLPADLDTFLFVTSGSEANDLALQLAKRVTKGHDVIAVQGSFHGSLSVTDDISSRYYFMETPAKPKFSDWVHMIPCPDLYHGEFKEDDCEATQKYLKQAKEIIANVRSQGRKISCFISEPIICAAGVIVPPPGWLATLYREIRAAGGIAIADETQTGMGRNGNTWWCFQYHNVTPDILTIGKPIGNGYPMALVVTKKSIAARLTQEEKERYTCDPVAAAIGLAVINALRSENLLKNARDVGCFLREGLKSLAATHPNIGHVRGIGLMCGVEIVHNRNTRQPYRALAEQICYKMKEKYIVIANDGTHRNVLVMIPPMCFSCENAHRVITTLSNILKEAEQENAKAAEEEVEDPSTSLISLGVLDDVARVSTSKKEASSPSPAFDFLALD